jgi:DNA-binding MarR family transcriptional regulator
MSRQQSSHSHLVTSDAAPTNRLHPTEVAISGPGAWSPPEEGSTPTAVELAEALLNISHAFKQWGNLCFSHAEPGLRELSVPRARLLAAVVDAGPGRVRMGDLSAALGVTARNVTTIVDALEREDLLLRRPDPTDRRAILLELTEKGKAHVERIHEMQHDLAERMFAPLNADERCVFYRLLTQLASHLAQVTGADSTAQLPTG